MKKYIPIVIILALISLLFLLLKPIVVYLVISWVIALLLDPILEFITNIRVKGKSVSRGVGAAFLVLSSIYLMSLTINWILPDISAQIKLLSNIDPNEVLETFHQQLVTLDQFVATQLGIHDFNSESLIKTNLMNVVSIEDFSSIFSSATAITGNLLMAVFSISFICFFMLKDKAIIFSLPERMMSAKNFQIFEQIIDKAQKPLKKYFSGVLLESLIVSILLTIGLNIIGVENSLLIGIIGGALNLIPYIGPIISLFTGLTIISFYHGVDFQNIDFLLSVLGKAIIVYLAVQLIDNFALQPIIYSSSVNAHPLEVFIIILTAGHLWGIKGMIFAIPLYTIIKIFISEYLSYQEKP